jgi:hypothetical protein
MSVVVVFDVSEPSARVSIQETQRHMQACHDGMSFTLIYTYRR